MTSLSYPDRLYLLSDTFSGHKEWNPLSRPDIETVITTHIRSDICGVSREFDISGTEGITDHILRSAVYLHDKNQDSGTTGIFINSAPRLKQGENGEPFYIATTDNKICIVATPLSVLSAIRDRIGRLQHLPNTENGLYPDGEQFRSSYTPRLLAENHGLALTEDDHKSIPEYPLKTRVAYVDKFGHILAYEQKRSRDITGLREEIYTRVGETCQVTIGDVTHRVLIGQGLKDAEPGCLTIYPNDHNVDLVVRWDETWDERKRRQNNAFTRFRKARIGAPVSVRFEDNPAASVAQ